LIIAAAMIATAVLNLGNSVMAQPTAAQLAAADAGQLPIVSYDNLPPIATYWLRALLIPAPFDLWPDMVCYDLGDGSYLLDDRGYLFPEVQSGSSLEPDGSGYWPWIGGSCGCAPWLTIGTTGSNAVRVSVHRLAEGQTCAIYS